MIYIILFLLIIHVALIYITYKNLHTGTTKEKVIFILVGIGLIYFITSMVYALSNMGVEFPNDEVSSMATQLITFTFVPVNALVCMPMIASSYSKVKNKQITKEKAKKKIVIAIVLLVIFIIFEYFYMKDIQTGILNMIRKN